MDWPVGGISTGVPDAETTGGPGYEICADETRAPTGRDFRSLSNEFRRMLANPLIAVELNTDFRQVRQRVQAREVFYSGPIDEYFDCCFGPLPYRSLRFEHEHLGKTSQFQSVGTVNYPNDFEFTRITEFKHLTGQKHPGTSVVREYPQLKGDPYYPIPTEANQSLYRQYKVRADAEPNVHFIGRLAEYRYYNMDQVVAAALKLADGCLSVAEPTSRHPS
jgi:UDP-galactopyranose mutase